jgi:hypothetical protein
MGDKDDLAQIKQRADAIGLTNLSDENLRQLQRATAVSLQHKANLKIELSIADEPAHFYSLKAGA